MLIIRDSLVIITWHQKCLKNASEVNISIKVSSSTFDSTTVQKLVQSIVSNGTCLCKPPKPVSFTKNAAHNRQEFKQQLTWFLAAIELSEKSDSVKIKIMLTHSGKEAHKITKHFPRLLATKWNSTRLSKPSENIVYCVRKFFRNGINFVILKKTNLITQDTKSRLITATMRERAV